MPTSAPVRLGPYTLFRPSPDRQLSIDAYAALPPSHLMTGLLELDVSDALAAIARLKRRGVRVSLFAFLVHAIAVAIAEHPDLNLVSHGRRLVRFEDVDVSVPVEVQSDHGPYPRQVVLRRAQDHSPAELYAEIEAARTGFTRTGMLGGEDRRVRWMMRVLRWVPRFVRLAVARWVMRSAFRIKRMSGTTLVSSVGKFAATPGFGFSFTTGPRASAFLIGGVTERPWVRDGRVAIRSIVTLAVQLNHDLVDGSPAARFACRLQELVETADGLDAAGPPGQVAA